MLHPLFVYDFEKYITLYLCELVFVLLRRALLYQTSDLFGKLVKHVLRAANRHIPRHEVLQLRQIFVFEYSVYGVKIPQAGVFRSVAGVFQRFSRKTRRHIENHSVHVLAVKHLVAVAVYDLTLLVVDLVVLQHVLALRVMYALYAFLRPLDLSCYYLCFYGHVLFQLEKLHDRLHSFATEHSRKVVLGGKKENAAAGVSLSSASAPQLIVYAAALVTLGAYDMQTARFQHLFLFGVADGLVLVEKGAVNRFEPFRFPVAVRVRGRSLYLLVGIIVALHFLLCKVLRISSEQNIRAAPRHVGGDGDCVEPARLRDDFSFARVVFGVEHVVGNAFLFQHCGKLLAFFHRNGADKHGLSALVAFNYIRDEISQLCFARGIKHVVVVLSYHRLVGGNFHYVEIVNIVELRLLRLCRTRHAAQFFVHTEQILEGDCGKSFVFLLYADVFLCLDCLVQPLIVTPALHDAPRELVHYFDLALVHDIVVVALHDENRFERLIYIVVKLCAFHVAEIVHLEKPFRLGNAARGKTHSLVLFVFHGVILLLVLLVVALAHNGGKLSLALAADNQRSARFVDKYAVNLVDNGEIESALHKLRLGNRHVVSQIVEAEFVVGAVGYVAGVSSLFFLQRHIVVNHAYRKPEKFKYFSHPLGVASGKVFVYRHYVNAASRKRV